VATGIVGVRLGRKLLERPARVPREVALERGLSALAQGLDQEAEAWFRRGLASAPGDPLLAINLSVALNNESFRVSRRRGVISPDLPTSLERFRAAQESMLLYKAIEATQPPGLGLSRDRAQLYDSWGFPLEALQEYERARAIEDTTAASRDAIARIVTLQVAPVDGPDQYAEP
jgi:hypothetical protein